MRFALPYFQVSLPRGKAFSWPRILPLALVLTVLPGCSLPKFGGNEPPTARAVTKAEMDATPAPPRRPPMPTNPPPIATETPREKKGWFAPLPKLPKVSLPKPPKLWPFGGQKEDVVSAPAPEPEPGRASKPAAKPKAKTDEEVDANDVAANLLNPPDHESAPEKKPGFLSRAAGALPFVKSDDEIGPPPRLPKIGSERQEMPEVPKNQQAHARSKDLRGLEMRVLTDPAAPSANQDRRINVNILLYNEGKKSVSLRFGSTQTREILIRDANGALVTRWSEDYVFDRSLTGLLINPGERIEFKETISTRDLVPGRRYSLDVGIQGYSELQVSMPLTLRP